MRPTDREVSLLLLNLHRSTGGNLRRFRPKIMPSAGISLRDSTVMEMLVLLGDNFPEKTSQHCLTCGRVRIFTEISEECCGLYQVIMCFHHIETCPTLIRLVSYLHRRNWNQRSHTHTTQVSGLSLQIDKFRQKKSCIGSPDQDPTYRVSQCHICI